MCNVREKGILALWSSLYKCPSNSSVHKDHPGCLLHMQARSKPTPSEGSGVQIYAQLYGGTPDLFPYPASLKWPLSSEIHAQGIVPMGRTSTTSQMLQGHRVPLWRETQFLRVPGEIRVDLSSGSLILCEEGDARGDGVKPPCRLPPSREICHRGAGATAIAKR